jgi:CRP-like cAMP-binding protein
MIYFSHKCQPGYTLKTRTFDTILRELAYLSFMFELFETYITANGDFTPEDLQLMRSLSTVKKVRRKEFLLKEGEVCRYKIFIAKGLLKSYCLRSDGTEHIMQFSPENSWTTDPESLKNQTPAQSNIEALENSEVVMWTHENLAELFASIPAFKLYMGRLMENALKSSRERIRTNLSYTSEEKYEDFIATFPDVFRRVPLHMVASYLGVSRETLSRIRHARVKQ